MIPSIKPQLINNTLREHLPSPAKKILKKLEKLVYKTAIILFNQRHSYAPKPRPVKEIRTKSSNQSVETQKKIDKTPITLIEINPRLFIVELTGAQLKTAEKVTAEWTKTATEKAKIASGFSCSESITRAIANRLQQQTLTPNNRVFACFDSLKKEQQAIAIVSNETNYTTKKPYLYVNLLATNPNNIRSSINKKEKQITGGGTALISYLVKVCQSEDKDELHLTSLHSALPFYKKIGFQEAYPKSYNLLLTVK